MTSQKMEYDAALGGTVELPPHLPTYRYAAESLNEIKTLIASIDEPTSTKLIFQTLPKHMRRRAMSHHPKRLPRKYRTAHMAQMAKAGKPQQSRRPSRKFRRRPGHLLREYVRRQRQHKWLETHIWHARRFHMINRWGYRLPYASCDKTYRACYRASSEHCLLQDISFHACLELEGSIDSLRVGFSRLSDAEVGRQMTSPHYLSGTREGRIELFRDRQKPNGALGSATFMWRPAVEISSTTKHTLWLWLHPSGYAAVREELLKALDLTARKPVTVDLPPKEVITEPPSTGLRLKRPRRLQFMTRTLAYRRVPQYANSESGVEFRELRDTINRYRLTGPLSQRVLTQAFRVRASTASTETPRNWQQQLHQDDAVQRRCHDEQAKFWTKAGALESPAELLSNMILALNIDDPRIHRPQTRCKAPSLQHDSHLAAPDHLQLLVDMPKELPQSSLWDPVLMKRLGANMHTTHAYCRLRAQHVMALGQAAPFEQRLLQPVPVLLVQRPGSQQAQYKRLGYGCGWDVIVPAGYGMSVWLALIMWGARPGGLREFDSVAREMGCEQHLPDTVAGLQAAAESEAELRARYFRLPTNKRCNYSKLAIVSPFRAPLRQLVRDWLPHPSAADGADQSNSFHVLRNSADQAQLADCLRSGRMDFPQQLSPHCLVQVEVLMKSRGNLKDFALICLPTASDLKRNLRCIKNNDHRPVYTEPLRRDRNAKARHQLRLVHKRLLKRLRARRLRVKRKLQETSNRRVHIEPANTSSLVAAQHAKMSDLWLPNASSTTPHSVRKQCSRDVFGYVTRGAFSYTEARPCGIGYLTVEGLRALITRCTQARLKQPMCLVRGPTTRHYRFATIKVSLMD